MTADLADSTLADTPARTDIDVARTVLATEAAGLRALSEALDHRFAAAIDLLNGATGRIVVSGMGKSGLVARKIAATMASTGTPALFVHPAEASHGDLGMISPATRSSLCRTPAKPPNSPTSSPIPAASASPSSPSPAAPAARWPMPPMWR